MSNTELNKMADEILKHRLFIRQNKKEAIAAFIAKNGTRAQFSKKQRNQKTSNNGNN